MATPVLERARAALQAFSQPSMVKSIWGTGGGGYLDFMGIASQSDADTIEDNPAGYAKASVAESYVYKCLNVRGQNLSQAPLRAYKKDSDGGLGDAVPHEALDILDFSNPMTGQVRGTSEMMRFTLGALDLHGRSAFRVATSRNGKKPTELYWTSPLEWVPERDSQTYFAGLRLLGSRELVPASQVIYLRTANYTDPLRGQSKIQVLRSAINLRRFAVRSNTDFFQNSQRPDWILSGAFSNTQENVERIRRQLRRWLTGENNRSPLVLGENAKATLLTISPKDAEWIAQQRLSGEEISSAFSVPVIYLNNFERATYENASTARLILWHDGLIPDGNMIASQLTREYLWRWWPETIGKIILAFDYTAIDGLSEDAERKTNRILNVLKEYREGVTAGIATPAQVRAIWQQLSDDLGVPSDGFLGDVPGGDHILAPYTLIPKGTHSVQEIIDVMAARSSSPSAPYLIEDVPGAENAGKNTARAISDANARAQAALPPPPDPSAPPPKPPKPPKAPKNPPPGDGSQPPPAKGLDPDQVTEIVKRELGALKSLRLKIHPRESRERRLERPTANLTSALKREFQAQQKEALRTFRARGKQSQPADLETKAELPSGDGLYDSEAARERLKQLIREGVITAAEAAYAAAAEDYSLPVTFERTGSLVDAHIGKRAHLIRGIDDTTREGILGALQDAVDNGDSMDMAADRISAVFRDAIDNRSRTIARTELIQAYGSASLSAYKEGGVEQAEMYDGDDDDECANVDGQVVSLEEADQLMADEHPNGTRGVSPVIDKGDSDEKSLHIAPGIRVSGVG